MKLLQVTVPMPAGAVWLNSNDRKHFRATDPHRAAWRAAGAKAVEGRESFEHARVTAHVWKPRAGRYDPMNLWPTVKALLDGMVDAGLFPDDDWRHVVGPDMRHGGIGPAGLVLVVEELSLCELG
jgi:hypothetical protein